MYDEPEPTAHVTVSECTSFYFINVIFQVEDMLFRVPRRYFEQESEVFRTMFQLPVANGAVPDGNTNEQPLRLEGVAKDDFHQLLRAMFPESPLVPPNLSVKQWTAVLKLASLWQMDGLMKKVLRIISNRKGTPEAWLHLLEMSTQHNLSASRALAVEKIGLTRGTEKVVLARKYGVKQWLRDGLRELVERQKAFSDEEDEKLGLKTVLKLYRIRDNYRNESQKRWSSYSGNGEIPTQDAEIEREFGRELNEMEEDDHDGSLQLDDDHLHQTSTSKLSK